MAVTLTWLVFIKGVTCLSRVQVVALWLNVAAYDAESHASFFFPTFFFSFRKYVGNLQNKLTAVLSDNLQIIYSMFWGYVASHYL